MCVLPLHNPSVLMVRQSILMPPPAKPSSKILLRRPLHRLGNGQRSSPFFSGAIQNGSTKIALQAPEKRDLESDHQANKALILPKTVISTKKRQTNGSREKIKVRSEAKEPAETSALQVVGRDLSYARLSRRPQRLSIDLDYEECRLYDRVSREEASVFRSAKSYGQSVDKRRKLGD